MGYIPQMESNIFDRLLLAYGVLSLECQNEELELANHLNI